jgi:hypothetical protein
LLGFKNKLSVTSNSRALGSKPWADAAEMYEQARNAPDLMKGFVNTVLGLPFEEEAEAPEWQRLRARRGRDLRPRPVRGAALAADGGSIGVDDRAG